MSFKQDAKKNFPEWPIYDSSDINALLDVVKSGNWWCGFPGDHQGENVWKFQKEFAKLQEARKSGTSKLPNWLVKEMKNAQIDIE